MPTVNIEPTESKYRPWRLTVDEVIPDNGAVGETPKIYRLVLPSKSVAQRQKIAHG